MRFLIGEGLNDFEKKTKRKELSQGPKRGKENKGEGICLSEQKGFSQENTKEKKIPKKYTNTSRKRKTKSFFDCLVCLSIMVFTTWDGKKNKLSVSTFCG